MTRFDTLAPYKQVWRHYRYRGTLISVSRVRFLEFESDAGLRALEKRVVAGLEGVSVRLFRDVEGRLGYSARVSASATGKRALDLVHRRVCEAAGVRRGRPPAEPTRQVKCRVPESVYRRLVAESRRRRVTPSALLKEWLMRRMG